MSFLQYNLVCANGHSSYSPTPENWVTTKCNQRFCGREQCYGRNVSIRKIDGEFKYESPYVAHPPSEVMEQWLEQQ